MSLTKKINKLIKERPQYEINQEAFDNQAIATSQAFGRDRSIQAQETQNEQDAANSAAAARDVSSSTSGLLNTIAAINASKMSTNRGLAQDEASIQNQKIQQLYGANNQMIEEKDKAWDFNVNQPYQNKIQALRDRKKSRAELAGGIVQGVTTIAGAALGGPAGAQIGSQLGGSIRNGMSTEPDWGRGNASYNN